MTTAQLPEVDLIRLVAERDELKKQTANLEKVLQTFRDINAVIEAELCKAPKVS